MCAIANAAAIPGTVWHMHGLCKCATWNMMGDVASNGGSSRGSGLRKASSCSGLHAPHC